MALMLHGTGKSACNHQMLTKPMKTYTHYLNEHASNHLVSLISMNCITFL